MIFRIHLYYMPLVYKEYIQSSQNAVYISIYFNPVSIDSTEKALTAKANSPQMPKRPTRCKHECPHLQSCSSLLSPFRQKNSAHGLSVYHSLSIPCTLQKNQSKFRRLSKACMVRQNGGWRWLQLAVGPALASWHFRRLCWKHWEVLTSKEAWGRLLNLEVPPTIPT